MTAAGRRLPPLLLLLAGCTAPGGPPAPVETARFIGAPPATVRERMDRAVLGLGFVPAGRGPAAPFRLPGSASSAWADCPVVVISGDDDASQRDFARPIDQQAEVVLAADPDKSGTRAEVTARFTATYLQRFRSASFTRDCTTTGVLERRILDAAATPG